MAGQIFLRDNKKLMSEWNYEKNKGINPNEISAYAHKKVMWVCPVCKGEYSAYVYSRTAGNGCPFCTGKRVLKGLNDLQTINPKLAEEWHPTKNTLTPSEVVANSNKKYWWRCPVCGYEWQASLNHRNSGRGCPVCRGQKVVSGINDLKTTNPNIAAEWHPRKNGGLKPDAVRAKSNKSVWWKCSVCGHEWYAAIYSRVVGRGCPKCADQLHTSFPEQAIYYYLRQIDDTVRNRELIDNNEVDIYIPSQNIGIEYDGVYYHEKTSAKKRDAIKNEKLKSLGIRLIRVKEFKTDNPEITFENDTISYSLMKNYIYLDDVIKILIEMMFPECLYKIDVNTNRDRVKIQESYKQGALKNSFGSRYPELAKEWHPTKNGNLKPEMFSCGSHQKIIWRCKHGHEWTAQIKTRVSGCGCPVCANKILLKGFNDLATKRPDLAEEWHPVKNGNLKPTDVVFGSHEKVWWCCKNNQNHEWQATILDRYNGRNCPFCSNKKVLVGDNDLATKRPDLAEEWHPTKNGNLKPSEYVSGSTKKVWWRCKSNPNHEWEASIVSRSRGSGCPECAKERRRKNKTNDYL